MKGKRIAARLLLLPLLAALLMSAASAAGMEDTPADSFTYWTTAGDAPIPSKPVFRYETVLTGHALGLDDSLSKPQDICVDGDRLYIMDSGNGRILGVNTRTLELELTLDRLYYQDERVRLRGAGGIYADGETLYVCDTENGRVIISTLEGDITGFIETPDSEVIPEDFIFRPARVLRDGYGSLYVLSEGSFYGALRYRPSGGSFEFMGFYGANSTGGDVSDILSNIWDLLFSNSEKLSQSEKKVPAIFVDMTADAKGFLFTATNKSETGAVKRLSPGGSSVWMVDQDFSKVKSDLAVFGVRGEFPKRRTNIEKSQIRSVAADSDGFVYAADSKFGRILMYTPDGRTASVFGGGLEEGTQKGTFQSLLDIEVAGDRIFACDDKRGEVTVYRLTPYGELLKRAEALTQAGDYTAAAPLWESVLAQDANCQLAYTGLAQCLFAQERYEESLRYARMGQDYAMYAQAFAYVRSGRFADLFFVLLGGLAAAAGGVALLLVMKRRRGWVWSRSGPVRTALTACIHPFRSFGAMQERKSWSLPTAFALTGAFFATHILADFGKGFAYGSADSSYNAVYTLLGTAGIVLLWTAANWGVCAVMDGKGRIREVFQAAACSLVPLILSNLVYLVLSNLLIPQEMAFFTLFQIVCYIAAGFSLCVGTMVIHEYDFFRFLRTTLVTVLAMVLAVFVLILFWMMLMQLITFIQTLFSELRYR